MVVLLVTWYCYCYYDSLFQNYSSWLDTVGRTRSILSISSNNNHQTSLHSRNALQYRSYTYFPHMYTHTHIYIYIYILIEKERERQRERERERARERYIYIYMHIQRLSELTPFQTEALAELSAEPGAVSFHGCSLAVSCAFQIPRKTFWVLKP